MTGNNRDFKGRSRGGGDRGGSDRGHRWNGGRGRIYRGRGRGRGRGGGHPPGPGTGCFREKRPGGFSVGPRLVETDVGITEFISQHAGFSAVIKHRFSDFHVNEIDCDGNLVKLTTLDVPAEVPVEEDESSVERHKLIPPDIWEKLILLTKKEIIGPPEEVLGTVPTSTSASKDGKKSSENFHMNSDAENPGCPQVQSTANLTKACPETESNVECSNFKETGDTDRVEIDVTSLDKDSRRAIHMCIKKAFRDVISNTIEKDGKKSVVIRLKQGANCDRNQKKWPTSRDGEYLHFVVHKRNMDTTETVNSISYKLGLKPGNVTFAGTKDRRGITSQLMSIRKGEPSRLFSISKRIPNVFIGNYCFKKKPLRLGDLNGNQFRIALRNVDGSSEEIKAGLESLRINGFINYYGLQRFGTNFSVPTHSIGKALLLGLWQQAVDLILEPRDGFGNLRAALEEWKLKKDANKALQKLTGRTNCIEESLLKGLAALGPNDLVNALLTIPLNTRLLYLHAYQSFIWNQSVSYRIRESGLKPVIGDLVFIESGRKSFTKDLTIIADGSDATDSAEQDLEKVDSKQEVKYLTQENVGDYRMEDIVLPLPGYNVTYPNNKVGSYMLDLLTKDELTPEKFRSHIKQFSLGGTYRHIMARAENLSFKIVHYSDNETDLILSDLDELLKGKDPPQKDEDGKHTALILTMSLEPSTYATMALREITKEDTSATTQTSISAATISVFDGETSSHRAEVKETNLELIKKNEGMSIPLQESKEVEGETLTVADNTPVITIEGDESTTAENVAVLKRKGDELSEENVAGKKMKDNL